MPYKLLLADDSVTIQRVIELTFADEDVRVTAVGDGQQAIARIQSEPPDIVLADVGMPGRDGYEVSAFIKDTPDLAHVPVLLLTGAFEPVDEVRAKASRCDGVLAKPFEPQILIARVKALLEAASEMPAAEAPPEPAAPEPTMDDDDTGPVPIAAARPARPDDDLVLDASTLTAAASAAPAADLSLSDYFDRLDAAFSTLGGPASRERVTSRDADMSWAPSASGAWRADSEPPIPMADSAGPAAQRAVTGPTPSTAAPEPPPEAAPAAMPVADAFAVLLEAERHGDLPAIGAIVGPRAAAATEPTLAVTDALVDEVVRRLVERLAGEDLRDAVSRVVSETAERLVREEIERLKAVARSGQV